ncbi:MULTISPECIES: hypothetical protein [Streptomyces]|uniref:Uncharacterized protein n=1 Tax=Streptomyces nymphaeiformis TaxID=2663842 RepID=A0A7W7U0R3_9ACTN|nr:hypothetical protein [Streptomyces nymphaeiformis]MBB4982889.1 hypothetical protein [Streptomyces nymphaeiformis]
MTVEHVDASCVGPTRTPRRRGGLVLAVFGLVWALAGGSGTSFATPVTVVALAVTIAAAERAFRGTAGPVTRTVRLPEKWNRGVGLVDAAGLVAVFAVIAASNASGRPELIPVGLAALAAGAGAETVRAVVGLGAALVLWGTSFHVTLRG